MRIVCLLRAAALLVGLAEPALAVAPADTADCGATWPSRVLVAAPGHAPATDARALWLDRRSIRWPGAPLDGRYRLAWSATARLSAAPGAALEGADGSLRLHFSAAPAPVRFRHVAGGATLVPAPPDEARLRRLLAQQLLLVREDDSGRVLDATRVQTPGALDDLFAPAVQLGDYGAQVRRTGSGAQRKADTTFRVWAPTAHRVALCLHPVSDARAAPTRARVRPMHRDATTGSWHLRLRGVHDGSSYLYLVDVVVPGIGLVRNRVTDPYSLGLAPDSMRSVVVDLDSPALKPAGWDTTARPARIQAPTDLVIYELHVRDFSAGDDTVPPAHRGKYLAFTVPATSGMQHLQRLARAGVTDVHLLPVFDLATVPEQGCATPVIPQAAPDSEDQQAAVEAVKSTDCFNWGYDPWHYTAPEGSYATEGASAAQRIVEFRRMVQTLHSMGLRVGMDVVYNHTSAAGQHAHSVLDRIVPGYYHRLDENGDVERSTCCANTATEHLMMGKLMIDSAVVWARDHHIDSFRFDLMGHQPRALMEQLQRAVDQAAGRPIHLIGEGWNFGEVADGRRFVQASQLSLNGSGIATFSDRARDAVRGGSAGDNGAPQIARQGFVNGLYYDANALAAGKTTALDLMRSADLVRVGLAGSIRTFRLQTYEDRSVPLAQIDYAGQPAGYVSQPGEVVNYVENHDNQTLFDANVFKLPVPTSREDRARVQTLAHAINAFSQGVAYFHAGQELLRSKSMDRNSYDSGDWFNRIDWRAQDNHFGVGLPPRQDNAESWPLMRPLLADAAIKPTAAEIAWTRDAFLDLLKIRASTTLLRLRSAADIEARLQFFNTGAAQEPTVIAAHLDGAGYAGAGFAELVYLVNVDKVAHRVSAAGLKDKAFKLHPVHTAPQATDRRASEARYEGASGSFNVPARTAVVFVVD